MGSIFRRFPSFARGTMIAAMLTTLPVLMVAQTFVQANSNTTRTTTSSISIAFATAQTAGNLNVVVVGWADTTSTVHSVTDSNGNTYALAAGTNATTGGAPGASQAVYYAKNIKAGSNTVTVTFDQVPINEDVRILEYSGLSTTAPLDTTAGTSGIGTAADSSPATTNSATDLLIGAGTSTDLFTAAGTGFVQRTFPGGYGDMVEDQDVATAGPYDATATATLATTKWVMQIVAFRAAGQAAPSFPAPTITSLNGSTAADTGGDPLTITGTNFVAGATVLFSNGTTSASAINCSVAASTTINCTTPAFPLGPVDITVTNVDGKATTLSGQLTIEPANPQITNVSVISGNKSTNGGTKITITGSDFAAGASVTIGGVPADLVSVQNSNTITCDVPANSAGAAAVVVTNPGGRTATLPGGFTYITGGGISFVQAQSQTPVSPSGSTAGATYALAQHAGDVNVVVISWADTTATVQSVTDSAGNTYVPALNPIANSKLSQAIYYAKNIKASGANSNTVTVTFNASATTPDLRALEYAGIDTANPVDTAKSASSPVISTTADTGPFTTTFATDLVIAAVTPSTSTAGGGPGFITVSLPSSGDYVEHAITSAAGTVDAQATLKTSGAWVIQAVAFRESPTASQPNFAVSASPSTISVTPGSSATYTVTVTPQNGFSTAVNLSVTCPANVQITCSISPSSVTPGSASVTATLTVATTGATAALSVPQSRQLLPLYALFLPLPGIAFIGAGWAGSRRRKLGIGAAAVLMFLLLLLLLGCGGGGSSNGGGGGGGGNSGTPAGTYNVTVTATSGSVSHTATAAVTVQ
jgi:hypothetical protein